MARGKRGLSTAEQIEKLESAIAEKEAELKSLKSQKKALSEQKRQEDLSELYKIITASGKSMEEIKTMLAK